VVKGLIAVTKVIATMVTMTGAMTSGVTKIVALVTLLVMMVVIKTLRKDGMILVTALVLVQIHGILRHRNLKRRYATICLCFYN